MVGGETQSFNVKVEMPGRADAPPTRQIFADTLETVERTIRVQDYLDEETKEDLILMARSYPDTALKYFISNFNLMIMRSREKRAKEQI